MLAKLSANGTRSRLVAGPAALACAAVAGTALVAGCGSGPPPAVSAVAATGSVSAGPGSVGARVCTPWAGLDDLDNVTTWLRQMIGDEVIFGAGTAAAKRDGRTVIGYAQSVGGSAAQLPARYAAVLRSTVLTVAVSPYQKTPEQLNTAANNAANLATQLTGVCT